MTNWLTNAKFGSAKRDGMSIHAGFDDAAAALQPGILNYLQEHHGPTSTLMVTGHSLGAALATLTAHDLRSQGHVTGPIALVSFASPRVGFGDFRTHFASLFPRGAWRVTRPDDAVTNLPPFVPVIAPWVHVPGEIYFSQQNGPTRRCCNDASGADDQCSGSSNEILETLEQHVSTPYMVTGDHVVSIGCEGVALQCSAGSAVQCETRVAMTVGFTNGGTPSNAGAQPPIELFLEADSAGQVELTTEFLMAAAQDLSDRVPDGRQRRMAVVPRRKVRAALGLSLTEGKLGGGFVAEQQRVRVTRSRVRSFRLGSATDG